MRSKPAALLERRFAVAASNDRNPGCYQRDQSEYEEFVVSLDHRDGVIFDPHYNPDYFDVDETDETDEYEIDEPVDTRHDETIDYVEEDDEYEAFLNRNDKCRIRYCIEEVYEVTE